MPIYLPPNQSSPQILLNQIYWDKLKVTQPPETDAAKDLNTTVTFEFRQVGEDETTRVYGSQLYKCTTLDFITLSRKKFVDGNPTYLALIELINSVIADIVADQHPQFDGATKVENENLKQLIIVLAKYLGLEVIANG